MAIESPVNPQGQDLDYVVDDPTASAAATVITPEMIYAVFDANPESCGSEILNPLQKRKELTRAKKREKYCTRFTHCDSKHQI